MKKNLLLINVFWLFVCAFLGTIFYLSKRQIEGVWILSNIVNIIKAFWLLGLLTFLSLGSAFSLDKLRKIDKFKTDAILIEFFIIVFLVAFSLIIISSNTLNCFPKGYLKIFHYFIISAILGYILFLTFIAALKICFKIIFTDLNEENDYKDINLLITPFLVTSGTLACLIRAKFLLNENIIRSIKGYLIWINKGVLILIIVAAIFILLTHLLASFSTKKGKRNIICAFIWLIIGVIIILFSKYSNLNPNFKQLSEVSYFIFGAYLFPLLFLLLCYSIKPFVSFIIK